MIFVFFGKSPNRSEVKITRLYTVKCRITVGMVNLWLSSIELLLHFKADFLLTFLVFTSTLLFT